MTGKDFQYNARRIQLLIYYNFYPIQRNALGNAKFYHPSLSGLEVKESVDSDKGSIQEGVMHENVRTRWLIGFCELLMQFLL
ncbi:hypothetical protein DVF44_17370 [Salmonella enterica subsp. enterica serovar Schwarzengrund]|nr:hypothetical protein [Salmonella enterica subsp. enterica serovar Brandenburg]EBY2673379.1 hypothetical protein [Salmonella enterica subsp. enterica serovar Schwarzengrund]